MANNNKKGWLLWLLIFLPYLLVVGGIFYYFKKVEEIQNSSFVLINKADMTLSLFDYRGKLIQKSGIATGKVSGNKKNKGDLKTPEGVFRIVEIQDASNWSHDFKDDTLGDIKGAYGPYFIRLDVPGQKGIGIHGTHDSNSIGTRASEGCIRMHNDDVRKLAHLVRSSCVVVITPGLEDVKSNAIDTIISAKNVKENSKQTNKVKLPELDSVNKKVSNKINKKTKNKITTTNQDKKQEKNKNKK